MALPCSGLTSLFYAFDPDSVAQAKALCHGCERSEECYTGAVAAGEHHGVWGGVDFAHNSDRRAATRARHARRVA